jgi:tRNA U55 pseudouridine synthase TruB
MALTCSAGFYVRSFAHTLGEQLGSGACLEALRRTRSGEFRLDSAVTLDAIDPDSPNAAELLVPMEELLPGLPSVRVTDEGLQRVSHGRELDGRHLAEGADSLPPPAPAGLRPGAPEAHYVRLMDGGGRLLALATNGTAIGSLHPSVVLI